MSILLFFWLPFLTHFQLLLQADLPVALRKTFAVGLEIELHNKLFCARTEPVCIKFFFIYCLNPLYYNESLSCKARCSVLGLLFLLIFNKHLLHLFYRAQISLYICLKSLYNTIRITLYKLSSQQLSNKTVEHCKLKIGE